MSESTMTVSEYGYQEWRNDKGELHRDGGLPAVIWTDGGEEYWKNDERHRDGDLPAIENVTEGIQCFYCDDKLHRAGGLPAIVRADGSEEYWVNGKRHRDGDLPAVIWDDGLEEYWENGKLIKYLKRV